MDISINLPLDSDGFLRRGCPHCNQEFKWHHGPANEEAEHMAPPGSYFCPLCGLPAEPDHWNTEAQVQYIEGVAMPAVLRQSEELMRDAFKGLGSKHFRVKTSGHIDTPDEPVALIEPDDMTIVASPCHAYEPVKVPDDAVAPLHCLVCGQPFAV